MDKIGRAVRANKTEDNRYIWFKKTQPANNVHKKRIKIFETNATGNSNWNNTILTVTIDNITIEGINLIIGVKILIGSVCVIGGGGGGKVYEDGIIYAKDEGNNAVRKI